MKLKMRKTTATVLASTLLVMGILSGCGAKSADTGNSNDKVTTISVWGMGEEAKSIPKIAELFEAENPNIKVEVQALPWDTAHDKLLTAVASKKGPDVVQMGTTWIPEFANAKALKDLTPYLDKYPGLKQENFYPGSVETGTYEDAYVGVPWYIDTRVLYYRTDLLKEVGYDQAPKTWEEMQDVSKKLADRGQGKYGFSLDVKEQSLAFMLARQNGSKLFDAEGKPLFNQPEFVGAVKYMNSYFENGSAPMDLGIDAIQGFRGEGVAPMFISGPWMVQLIQDQAPELEGKWATAVLPAGKENNFSSLGGANMSVFEYTKNEEASLKFVEFMAKPETQLKWMELTNSLPSSKEAWENPILQEDANYKVFGEQLETAIPMPSTKEFEEIAQSFLSSFEKVYRTKGADIQKEMDDFNKKAESIINK
ncbi:sugar ABC transporter substrate-binding protein [Paenibacillus segetis]|uniref:Sugar ABC transporter substrate-binding protein n=1 Tax=Paenibacillus segetis TaxID=1325360 RepID=A0ABQ1Y2U0_9BACL|nr:sugar ABC transporter substrate-binding protein [Paenibacillus segetis]GGH10559.1 sugar ABC transporter substrate-binding protein [Paenibacillus segetis]